MNVILVHGFLNRGGILRRVARHLTDSGHACFLPSLRPCDARQGLRALAYQLSDYIEANLGPRQRFALVGFSMGAIVARYYLQELRGWERAEAFFSIAGPHGGTLTAYLYPGAGVAELRPGSPFLRALDASAHRLARIPFTCYWTPFDLMIRPLTSARWPGAEHVRILTPLHSLLVVDSRLCRDIERRLAAIGRA